MTYIMNHVLRTPLYPFCESFPALATAPIESRRLTACVNDNDGEFLLIEAATAIPPFLSPANR